MITALSLILDKGEYSRYTPGLTRIGAAVIATGAAPGDVVTWTLARNDGFGTVGTGTATCAGATPAQVSLLVDLNVDVLDADGLNFCDHGEYTFTVSANAGAVSASATTFISIVPLLEFKERWLYGITTVALEVLAPVIPPKVITGVVFGRFSSAHEQGPLLLSYDATAHTLSWAGGTPVPIAMNAPPDDYILLDQYGLEYAVVRVAPAQLPVGSVAETIVVDKQHMDERMLSRYVGNALTWLEGEFKVPLETRKIMSDVLWQKSGRPHRDQIRQGGTWLQPYDITQWLNVDLPVRRLLKIYALEGWFNQTKSLTVQPEWMTINERQGLVELVPSAGTLQNFQIAQATYIHLLYTQQRVLNFWQYDVACGIRDLRDPAYAIVREAIARRAAIEVLLQAGGAYKAGIAQETLSRDNIHHSITYTQSAMYSVFSHVVIPYQEWIKDNLPKLKQRIVGVIMTTL